MNPLRKIIHPEARIIDARLGLVDYIASDESLDCYREIIKADGWKFDRFQKNAPFVDSHNYDSIECLLGKVTSFEVRDKKLVERVQWAIDVPEQPLATLGFKLTEKGYLKAVSVGFFPEKMASKWGDNQSFVDAVEELGLDAPTAAKVCCIFLEQQQIELSACVIGANPNALAKAHKNGDVNDGELAALGMGDEELTWLAASANDDDEVLQRLIGLQLRRTISRHFRQKQQTQHTTESDKAARDSEVAGRQRAAFLAEFKQHTQRKAE